MSNNIFSWLENYKRTLICINKSFKSSLRGTLKIQLKELSLNISEFYSILWQEVSFYCWKSLKHIFLWTYYPCKLSQNTVYILELYFYLRDITFRSSSSSSWISQIRALFKNLMWYQNIKGRFGISGLKFIKKKV